jgi:putative ABC transport system substrate-binding protein
MNRREAILAFATFGAAPFVAYAQRAGKVYRVAYLQIAPRKAQLHLIEAFERGLSERGYVIGRNVLIEYRFADGKIERLPELVEELVHLRVDVIFTGVNPDIRAAQRATTTIPIVTGVALYPVEDGLVASLGRPGGNVTGLTQNAGDELAKRLQLLRQVKPDLTRAAALSGAGMSFNAAMFETLERAASSLGMAVVPLVIRGAEDVGRAFAEIERANAGGLLAFSGPIPLANRTSIISMAARKKLPVIWPDQRSVIEGGLMSYGADVADLFRRAGGYIDRILKGAKPADLPFEQPTKFVLAVNLKTAETLGLTIPRSLLLQADKVIE